LLAIGLYSSTHGIDPRVLQGELTVAFLAVTVGVLLKAVVIAAGVALFYPHPEALVLGVAVAQIDPLSVAALERHSALSPRGRTLLLAWASFDDPMTTLLTVYAASLALRMNGDHAAAGPGALTGGASAFLTSLALNLVFAAVIAALWFGGRYLRDRFGGGSASRASFAAGCVLLTAVLAIAVSQFWMLGVALVGLFLRPALARAPELFPKALRVLTHAAFLVATLAIGVVLATGVRHWLGLWLGMITFAAQMLVSVPLTRGRPRDDRIQLALAQQNGITAIVLSLLLEPMFDGVVATVAPAILVINALHLGANAFYQGDTTRLRDLIRRWLWSAITCASARIAQPWVPSDTKPRSPQDVGGSLDMLPESRPS
ncbi:MAG: hypothetical protein IRY90_01225, partial [Actinomadura rubrobrunea]|nr:hypothetical protein [Actinomadura rubrobrunea]